MKTALRRKLIKDHRFSDFHAIYPQIFTKYFYECFLFAMSVFDLTSCKKLMMLKVKNQDFVKTANRSGH